LQQQKIQEKKIKELDKTMENLNLGDQLEDFMICYDDTSDKNPQTHGRQNWSFMRTRKLFSQTLAASLTTGTKYSQS
jgi:hypothetical protein